MRWGLTLYVMGLAYLALALYVAISGAFDVAWYR